MPESEILGNKDQCIAFKQKTMWFLISGCLYSYVCSNLLLSFASKMSIISASANGPHNWLATACGFIFITCSTTKELLPLGPWNKFLAILVHSFDNDFVYLLSQNLGTPSFSLDSKAKWCVWCGTICNATYNHEINVWCVCVCVCVCVNRYLFLRNWNWNCQIFVGQHFDNLWFN